MKSSNVLACALLVAAAGAGAQMSPNMAMPKPASSAAAASATAMTEGVKSAEVFPAGVSFVSDRQ